MLTEKQGRVLLHLARYTIESKLGIDSDPPDAAELADPALQEKKGVFVTLKIGNNLRGCIGSLRALEPLVDGVRRHAENAAFHDHRFPPLRRDEVDKVTIDISVLSTPRKLHYENVSQLLEILERERPGVILQGKGSTGATFLPQVWEQLPDARLFLSQLSLKAGLPETAWQAPHMEILTYTVQSFKEDR